MTTLTVRFELQSAHSLPLMPEGHKCRGIHGHNYEVEVTLARVGGGLNPANMVVDSDDVKQLLRPLVSRLDHHYLNDALPDGTALGARVAANPTAEALAEYLLERVDGHLHDVTGLRVVRVRVRENARTWADATP